MGMAHHLGKYQIAAYKAEDLYEKEPTEENKEALAIAIDRVEDARTEARMEYEDER